VTHAHPFVSQEALSVAGQKEPAACGAAVRPSAVGQAATTRQLRLLTYNIQAGIATRGFQDYLTHGWKHVLPYPARLENLARVGSFLRGYDIVGLQEADSGSLRSGFVNLTEYLAEHGGFPYWYDQTNRDLGHFAQHSIGLVSRLVPYAVEEHRLPGRIKGRGALCSFFGDARDPIVLVIVHLALSRAARMRQLAFIAERLVAYRHVVLMGDLNCEANSAEISWLTTRLGLREPQFEHRTFPSWRPARNIDHILVSPSLQVRSAEVLRHTFSDHLPVAMEVGLPYPVAVSGDLAATPVLRAAV